MPCWTAAVLVLLAAVVITVWCAALQPELAVVTLASTRQRPVKLNDDGVASQEGLAGMLDDQARADAGALVAQPDVIQEGFDHEGAVDTEPGTKSGQSIEFEQIDLLIQSFGDQYVAHLRALTATLEQFYARRLAGRDEQIALLTEQLAARDAQLVELRRQLDASVGERAELTARLQATARSEMRYAQSLHVLDDQVRRLLEAHEAGHRMVGNNEDQVS